MKRKHMTVRLGNASLQVPVAGDEENTLRLAAEVTECLKEVEASSTRIDTQAFALLTAFEFARRLQREEESAEQDTVTLMKALDGIVSRLQKILAAHSAS